MKNLANLLVGLCVSFLSSTSVSEPELTALKGQTEFFDVLQRITPVDEYRVNYPVKVRVFSDPGEFECEYQNSKDVCRAKNLIFLLSDHDVNDFSKAFFSESAYGWEVVSSGYSNGIVKIVAKKRLFSRDLNGWSFEEVEFIFDASSGNPL